MQTTSSTQRLVPLIEELSQSLTEIASILKADAQTAAPAEETKTETTTTVPEQEKQQPEEKKSTAVDSSVGSSKSKKPKITKEEIRAVLAEKSQAGLTDKVKALLTGYGAKTLSGIDPSNYEELLAAAKALE